MAPRLSVVFGLLAAGSLPLFYLMSMSLEVWSPWYVALLVGARDSASTSPPSRQVGSTITPVGVQDLLHEVQAALALLYSL